MAPKSCHRQKCHHFAPLTQEFVTPECVLNRRLVPTEGEGGDNRLGGTVKFHRGSFRDCHHIRRARGGSGGGITYFQSQGYCTQSPSCFPSVIMWIVSRACFGRFLKLRAVRDLLATHKIQTLANYCYISRCPSLRNMVLYISMLSMSIQFWY